MKLEKKHNKIAFFLYRFVADVEVCFEVLHGGSAFCCTWTINGTKKTTLYCGLGSFSHVGSMPQISRPYSVMVRSLENLPLDAMLWIAISSHLDWF